MNIGAISIGVQGKQGKIAEIRNETTRRISDFIYELLDCISSSREST